MGPKSMEVQPSRKQKPARIWIGRCWGHIPQLGCLWGCHKAIPNILILKPWSCISQAQRYQVSIRRLGGCPGNTDPFPWHMTLIASAGDRQGPACPPEITQELCNSRRNKGERQGRPHSPIHGVGTSPTQRELPSLTLRALQ